MSISPQQQSPSVGAADLAPSAALWLLLAITASCFWPGIPGPFVFDDFPNLQNLALLGGHVDRVTVGHYLYAFIDNPGRPLSALSFLIDDADWPSSADPFKRNNILFHLIAGALVFWLAWLLAKLRCGGGNAAAWVALACAAMWLLHPMQLSTTMLVVQRMTVLSTIFMLLGLLAYLKLLCTERLPEFWRVAAAGIVLAVFGGIAFLCKENGVLVFAYATALNLSLLGPRLRRFSPANRRILLWGAASPVLLLATLAIAHSEGVLLAYQGRDFTIGERLMTQSRILFDYLGNILLPRIGGRGIFHDDYLVSRSLFDPASTALAVVGILMLLTSAVALRRRLPLYAFAVLWFFAGHLIESTVVALELYFEHRNYLPMVGPLFAFASLVCGAPGRLRLPALLVLATWLCTAGLLTFYNAGIWGDRGKLALVWAQQSPDSVRAIQTLAAYHADTGNIPEARRTLDAGVRRLPDRPGLRMQRVLLDCIDRGVTPAQWQQLLGTAKVERYDRGVPDLVTAFVKEATGGQCHGSLSIGAVRRLISILLANRAYADFDSRGYLHYELSTLALSEHDLDELMRQMDLSNRFRPNPLVSREQAIYLLSAGLPDAALEYLDRSDSTPLPWFKARMLDIESKNASLRKSAIIMRDALKAQAR